MANKVDMANSRVERWSTAGQKTKTRLTYPCFVVGLGRVTVKATSPSNCIEQLESKYGAGGPGQEDRIVFKVPAAHRGNGPEIRGNRKLSRKLR